MFKREERFSFFSHCITAIVSLFVTIYLVTSVNTVSEKLIALIYGLSVTFLFSASSFYHAYKQGENRNTLLRRLDHFAIYVMIAGSYTVVCWFYLPKNWFIVIVSLQWLMVAVGAYLKLIRMNTPRLVSTGIYLAMGWMVVIPMGRIIANMGNSQFTLLAAGGAAYTIGALFYAIKRPKINSNFGFHEIFHLFIIIGAIFHFLVVNNAFRTGEAALAASWL